MTFLNSLTSIILSAIAILLPIVSIAARSKFKKPRQWTSLSILLSMALCAVSIAVQVYGIKVSVLIFEDYSAVYDTIGVLSFICIAFACIVILLNALQMFINAKRA